MINLDIDPWNAKSLTDIVWYNVEVIFQTFPEISRTHDSECRVREFVQAIVDEAVSHDDGLLGSSLDLEKSSDGDE